ncbi:MAG: PKD domain-containing protein [Microbacterium sp.]|uniref:PKD domain-containing protein n=1 Tax=Microbacterium sp. TaxID=51671 RepID=UPI0039E6603C
MNKVARLRDRIATNVPRERFNHRVMRRAVARATVAVVIASAGAVTIAMPAHAIASRTVAFYSMDEQPAQATLRDSSGNGRNGTIGADVTPGVIYEGATAQRFATHLPSDGAFPGHVDRVPHNTDLNPDSGDFSVEIRLRTTYRFGNILQKGQGATAGGYWKVENPEGLPRCLFRGGDGASRTGYSTTPINDGQWHTIRCNRTSAFVEMWVDGVRQSRLNGQTGNISNSSEMSIGGKGSCDGQSVTCDYFVGDIDYVRVEKGAGGAPNSPPVAVADVDCFGLVCTMTGAASTDSDGAIQRYHWDFGDGTAYDGFSTPTATHTFATAGTHNIALSVTDDRGATGSTTREVHVAPVSEKISYVGQATSNGNATSHQVTVPSAVQAGDALLLFVSQNSQASRTGPSGVTGWTQADSIAQGYGRTTVWSKVAQPADAGRPVQMTFSSISKANMVLVAYRGTHATNPVSSFAAATDSASSAVRVTPLTTAATAQSWAVSYWMHGDASSSALTAPDGVTVRSNSSQTGGGRVTGLLADSSASVPTGDYGGLSATAASASTTNTAWTLILRPSESGSPANQPPTASFTTACEALVCTFDASASSDPEGLLVSYEWDFGDGESQTTSGPSTTRTYQAEGTFTVQLTVADGSGLTGTTTRQANPTAPDPDPTNIEFVDVASANRTSATHAITIPSSIEAGDTLVMFMSVVSPVTITNPAGWQALDTADGGSLRTRAWWRTASAGDAGATVQVPVGSSVKGNLMVAGYRGVQAGPPTFAAMSGQGSTSSRSTPNATVSVSGSWALSFWAHRDGTTTTLSVPQGVQSRATGTQSGGGHVTTLLADSSGGVPHGTYGGKVAEAEAASTHGVTWTIVLQPE